MTRRDRITLLAWTLLDYLPAPKGARWASQQKRGQAPSSWQSCPSCKGDGAVRHRLGHPVVCDRCRGRGRYRVDAYTEEQVSTFEHTLPRVSTRRVTCDRCGGGGVWKFARCQSCDGAGKLTVPLWADDDQADAIDGRDAMLDGITRRDRAGSYADLDRALSLLRHHDPLAARLFVSCYVVCERAVASLDMWERATLDAGMGFLADLMPKRIVVPAEVIAAWEQPAERWRQGTRRARAVRDSEIRRLANRGEPIGRIARVSGLSERSVRRVVYGRVAA